MMLLAIYLRYGIWYNKWDEEESLKWLYKAASLGNGEAMIQISLNNRHKDKQAAEHWREKALRSNSNVAKGLCYFFFSPNNPIRAVDTAFDYFEKAAVEDGNMMGYYYMGQCYRWGYGTPANLEEAAKWNLKGAAHGYYQCQSSLGHFFNGQRKCKEAMYWFSRAMEQGDTTSKAFYKDLYDKGYRLDWSVEDHRNFSDKFKKCQFMFLLCLKRIQITLPKDLRKMLVATLAKLY